MRQTRSLGCLHVLGLSLFAAPAVLSGQDFGGWESPEGGWDYVYEANDGEDVDGELAGGGSLDGTWNHQNGSDAWDGSGPGDEFRPDGVTPAAPGGAGSMVVLGAGEGGGDADVLSIVDTGDPRSRGFADPSNRKVWFCHDVSQDGVDGSFSLRDGFTLLVRSRLHPDVDPAAAGWQLPDGGVDNDAGQGVAPGYTLRDGGKGGHGFYDSGLDRNFSFTPHGTKGYQFPPQVGEGLPPANFLDVGDNTVFHAFWVMILAGAQADRYDVTVYVDGASEPTKAFTNMQLGDDTDCDGISHLHMGFHSTPQVGGFQIDYFGYKIGAFEPSSPCPGGFAASFDPVTGGVALSWSPVGSVDSYTIRRDGAPIAEGLAKTADSFTDASPARPAATYELVPIVGGAPKAGCAIASVTVRTVVCPVLTAVPDRAAGKVSLSWTEPKFFTATGYTVLRNGTNAGAAAGTATTFVDSPPPGEHTYELVVASTTAGACPTNPFATARLFGKGAIDVSGDAWDVVVVSGVAQIVTTTDGAKSLHFPAGPKTLGDTASFAAQVTALGTGDVEADRYRVELQARYDNDVRITNRSLDPPSFVHFALSRTGTSVAGDERAEIAPGQFDPTLVEIVEQVPNPGGDPTIDSASSAIVNTEMVGLVLQTGLNILEIAPVDPAGVPHDDNIQLFAVRIGPFAAGLDASLTTFPCPAGLSCTRDLKGDITLAWTAGQPHAYRVERDGELIATIPMGSTTSYIDLDPGRGFFTYTLRATDDASCPDLACSGGGGVPDSDGFIREWLVFGPLDWGCAAGCDAPGVDAMRGDYLAGTSDGSAAGELDVQPVEGTEIVLDPQADPRVTVRAAPRGDINPGRPDAGKWFRYVSPQSLVDHNVVFGGDPGNNFVTYACTYIDNTGGELTADLGVTSDDAVQVFIGDQEVHINNVARGVGLPGSNAFDVVQDVTVPAGVSRILVKVFEGGGDTGFALRFESFGVGISEGIEVNLAPSLEPPPPVFHRGDADDNGKLELTDAIRILGFLFLGAAAPTCIDAADADDNGRLELTDAIRVLGYLFLGAAPPAPPGPPPDAPCGADPTPLDSIADLGCEAYTHCP